MNTLVVKNSIHHKLHQLPQEAQYEVADYVEFLLYKHGINMVQQKPHPYAGCMKGTVVWMSDDFNAPLDDFKEYM
jgi:hypothetical protein